MNNISENTRQLESNKLKELLKKAGKKKKLKEKVTPIMPIERNGNTYDQSFTQQRQWFLEQLMPGAVSNVPQAIKIKGDLNITCLNNALNEIYKRHEILRTAFEVVDTKPSQIISDYSPLKTEFVDLAHLPEEEREDKAIKLAGEEGKIPFDISLAPLWRNKLIKITDNYHIFVITLHHIISDGWSLGIIMRELSEFYSSFLKNEECNMPPLPIQYVDYSSWQSNWINSGALESQLVYWKKNLQGIPEMLDLAIDKPRPAVQTYNGGIEEFELDTELLQSIQQVTKTTGASSFQVLLTGLNILMHHYSLQDDICIGTPLANRVRPELENMIGCFINTLVFRNNLSGDPSFDEVLKRVKKSSYEAYDNQNIPFERLVEELNIDRNAEYSPIFQVLFVQTEASMFNLKMGNLELKPLQIHRGTSQFDLSLFLTVLTDKINGYFEYNTDLLNRDTVKDLVKDYKFILQTALKNTQIKLSELRTQINPKKINWVISSTFTSKPVRDSLRFWSKKMSIPSKIKFTPYSQVFQQLIDKSSSINSNNYGANVLLIRIEDWMQGLKGSNSEILSQLETNIEEFKKLIKNRCIHSEAKLILCICPPSNELMDDLKKVSHILKIENNLVSFSRKLEGIFVVHYNDIVNEFNVEEINDPLADKQGHIPYTMEFFTGLGTAIYKKIFDVRPGNRDIIVFEDNNQQGGQENKSLLWHNDVQLHISRLKSAGKQVVLFNQMNEDSMFNVVDDEVNSLMQLKDYLYIDSTNDTSEKKIKRFLEKSDQKPENITFISTSENNCKNVKEEYSNILIVQLPIDINKVIKTLKSNWIL